MKTTLCLIAALAGLTSIRGGDVNQPWTRHTIDDSSRGADGTRLGDVNQDGLPDIVTGWEQGGITRVYVNPGPAKAKEKWPAVTVGEARSVEDAVFVDLDSNGVLDVVSSCEGKRIAMLIHWAPKRSDYMNAGSWRTEELPGAANKFRWMFATPLDVNQDGRTDIIAGGKGTGSELGWWEVPSERPRDLSAWRWHRLRPMGWLMSLETADMDGDGDADIIYTDRKGKVPGAFWMENTGRKWKEHLIGVKGREAMFLKRFDLDRDGMEDVIVATRPKHVVFCRRLNSAGTSWKEYPIKLPEIAGDAKAVNVADFDGDGVLEIVFSTERASGKQGVCRLVPTAGVTGGKWELRPISGIDGVKHDLVEVLDLDGDGDLDVITCEEVKNFGLIWYENPLK
ncbi:MAG: FG-GAP repeat domain-containing protein [Verrucomicrobiia bacterium]|jgi:hypothetical protein